MFLKPLVDLIKAGKIPPSGFKLSPGHNVNTEVFILAGRRDEAVDYRTSIALAYGFPVHHLKYGFDSSELRNLLMRAEPYRWKEWEIQIVGGIA